MELSVIARHQVEGVKKYRIEDRADWLGWRKKYVGASEIGALFGVMPRKTPAQLYAEKTGEFVPNFDGAEVGDDEISIPLTERGLILEPVALALAQRIKPHWRIDPNPVPGGYYFTDDEHGMAATPDAFIYADGEPGPGNFQIKAVAERVYKETWFENGFPQPPISFAVQTNVESAFVGLSWGVLGALVVGDFSMRLKLFRMSVKAALVAEARKRAKEFWRRVEMREPYPFDYARDGELIASLYANDDGSMVELDGERSARMYELLGQREGFKAVEAQAREAEKSRKALDAEIVALLGNGAGTILGNGTTVMAKTTRRGGYSVEPTSFRTVRVKDATAAPAKRAAKVPYAGAERRGAMPDSF